MSDHSNITIRSYKTSILYKIVRSLLPFVILGFVICFIRAGVSDRNISDTLPKDTLYFSAKWSDDKVIEAGEMILYYERGSTPCVGKIILAPGQTVYYDEEIGDNGHEHELKTEHNEVLVTWEEDGEKCYEKVYVSFIWGTVYSTGMQKSSASMSRE